MTIDGLKKDQNQYFFHGYDLSLLLTNKKIAKIYCLPCASCEFTYI